MEIVSDVNSLSFSKNSNEIKIYGGGYEMSSCYSMDWDQLISDMRFKEVENKSGYHRSDYQRDYDRIIFSSAFRRLGRKTQVHPLSANDHVHTRLTHSLETASVGRGIGVSVGNWLAQEDYISKNISPSDIGAIVQAACVAHDIGNPPFGHAGEYAIRSWYENGKLLDKYKSDNKNRPELLDLMLFEGNAQGLRILTQLENYKFNGGLRLSYSTIASTVKYPWGSEHQKTKIKQKFNIFKTESFLYKEIAKKLGLVDFGDGSYARHPLSYLMEAADDICYIIMDIEDALEMGICRISDVYGVLSEMGGSIDNISVSKNRKEIISLRTLAINNLINKCIEQFKENYSNIMDGLFSNDLISMIPGVEGKGIINARNLSKDKIWTNRRKIELEIGSHSCISTIMCSFIKAVSEYKYDSNCMSFSSKHLVKMMAESAPTSEDSHYQCYMKVNDFVSGMTDNYATYIAKQIAGMAQ